MIRRIFRRRAERAVRGTMANPIPIDEMEVIIRRVCAEEGIPQFADSLVSAICHPGRGIDATVTQIEDGTWWIMIQGHNIVNMTDKMACHRFIRILFSKLFPNQTLREHEVVTYK